MKLEKLEISENIKKFLDTAEGQKYFREITPNMSSQKRHEIKKSLINPPKTIRKRALLSFLEFFQ